MKNIVYSTDPGGMKGLDLKNFFDGWSKKPDEEVLRKSIKNADYMVLAIDAEKKKLVGYSTALSDDVLSAYIPFLEVEKAYRKRGIGKMLAQLDHLYMIDIVCDKELAGFYAEAGLKSWHAMIKRNYANQGGPI